MCEVRAELSALFYLLQRMDTVFFSQLVLLPYQGQKHMDVKGPNVQNPLKLIFTYTETVNTAEKQTDNKESKGQKHATLYFNVDAGEHMYNSPIIMIITLTNFFPPSQAM